MSTSTLHVATGLGALVRRRRGGSPVDIRVRDRRAVKDAIEAIGIPHTEVAAVLVDGRRVGLDHPLVGGEQVVVHDAMAPPAWLGSSEQPPAPDPVRFVADVHLGTLTRRLRLLGFDTWYRTNAPDGRLARISAADDRVLLSRDRQLLCRRAVRLGALVRADDPDQQLDEVVARFDLAGRARPGTLCVRCNGPTRSVDAAQVWDRLEPGTRAAGHRTVRVCGDCDQLYWPGSHAPDLEAIVRRSTR